MSIRRQVLASISAMLLVISFSVIADEASKWKAMKDKVQHVLDSAVEDGSYMFPGVALRVEMPEGVLSQASGLGELAYKTPMRPHDKFKAGSIIKPFVAVAILQLVEEGKLSLDDKITNLLETKYTQGFQHASAITVRMLLNHTSGIGEWLQQDLRDKVLVNPRKIWTPAELIDIAAKLEYEFKPGEGYAYNNTEYTLLGLIIDKVTGEDWRSVMRNRILEPLGLKNTTLPEPGDRFTEGDHAHGYEIWQQGLVDLTYLDPSMAGAAGGHALVTTTEDLAIFLRGLFAGKLFKKTETLEAMMDPDSSGVGAQYGLGLGKYNLPGGVIAYGHTGGTGGFSSAVMYVPAQNILASMVLNSAEDKAIRQYFILALQTVLQETAPTH